MKRNILIWIGIMLMIMSYCKDDKISTIKSNTGANFEASGSPTNIYVVMDNEAWKASGDTILNALINPEIEYFVSAQREFTLLNIDPINFKNSIKTQRNIIRFTPTENNMNDIHFMKNTYANGQYYVSVIANSYENFFKLIAKNKNKINNFFKENAYNLFTANLSEKRNKVAENEIQKKHNINIIVPNTSVLAINKDDVIIIEREFRKRNNETNAFAAADLYTVIYFKEYRDTNQLSKDSLISYRNEILKKYMRGKIPNSYMSTTSEELAPITYQSDYKDDKFYVKMYGYHELINDIRGGPFVNITYIDQKRNRLVLVDGNVFAPGLSYRELIMELEAQINTIKF